MKKLLLIAFACLSLGLVATGCGGDDDEDTGGSADQPAQTEEQASGGGAAKSNVEVGMKDIQFDPADVTVKKGGTVTWTNDESVPHDVTKEDGPGPDFASGEGDMQKGDTYKQTFKTPGEISYLCSVHPDMTGTITVE
jgi:plastocyanin